MSVKYRISRRALDDLDYIWDYSAQHWGDDRAQRYVEDIQAAVDGLNAGRTTPRSLAHVRPGYAGCFVGSHVLIVNEIDGGYEIVRILHQSMDFRRHLK